MSKFDPAETLLQVCEVMGCQATAVEPVERAKHLLATLKWALPLAELAIEASRQERLRCGHDDIVGTYKSGVSYVGIHQAEVDQIEAARSIAAGHTETRGGTHD